MNVHVIVVGPFEVNSYLVWGDDNVCLVIDPGDESKRIGDAVASLGLKVGGYAATHGHVDHISGLADMVKRYPAPVYMHSADASWAFGIHNALPPYYPAPRSTPVDIRLDDGFEGRCGKLEFSALATPGHTPGGVCLLFRDKAALFTGDTLFAGSIGRTDLPGSSHRTLLKSLKRLTALPGNTVVYPGHGSSTTVAQEIESNPYL